MCQPGRPGPQGLSQAGSPGLAPFHRAKSRGSCFSSRRNAGSGLHFIEVASGKLAIVLEGAHPVIYVAGRRGIGHVFANERFAHGDHFRNVFRGLGLHAGAFNAQAPHVLVKGVDKFFRNFLAGQAGFIGAVDDFIVHVREVAHKGHVQAGVAQIAGQHVKNHGGAGMPDMAIIIGGDAAHIHAHFAGSYGNEFFFAPVRRIVKLHISSPKERNWRKAKSKEILE